MTATGVRFTVQMSEDVSASVDLANSTLIFTSGGISRSASYVAADSNLAAGSLVYAWTGSGGITGSGRSLALGTVDLAGAVIKDAAGNAFSPGAANALVPLVREIDVAAGQIISLAGGVSGSADFIKTGAGELVLTANNLHTGRTIIRGGTLAIDADLELGPDVVAVTSDKLVIEDGATLRIKRSMTLDTQRGIQLSGQGRIDVAADAILTYSGAIGGATAASGLTKVGTGVLALHGTSSYGGTTRIEAGELRLGVANALGPATSGINTAVSITSGALLTANGYNQRVGSLSGSGTLSLGSAVFRVGGNGTSTSFDGVLMTGGSGAITGGVGYLAKEGSGTLTLGGRANSPSGRVLVEAGTLVLDKTGSGAVASALGGGTGSVALDIASGATARIAGSGDAPVLATADVVVQAGGTLDIGGRKLAIGRLTGGGTVTNGGTAATDLVLGNGSAGDFTFAGVLQDGAAGLRLTKLGTSTLTLSAVQAYTGVTSLLGGGLTLAGVNRLSDANALSMASGTTFTIGGVAQRLGSLVL